MMKNTYFPIGLVPLILLFLVTGCQPENSSGRQPVVIPVKVEKSEVKLISIPVHCSGRLMPKTQIKLSFKTGGIIEDISADEGDSVLKDQILAGLDMAEIRAGYNNVRNVFLKSKRDLERASNLYRDHAATLEQVQNATTAHDLARSNMEIARFNLDHSIIRAPFKGKILKRMAEVKEVIGAGHPVFLFGSTESRWVVKAGISARDVVHLKLKDTARVRFDAYPAEVFQAAVTEISLAVDRPAAQLKWSWKSGIRVSG